MTKRWVLFLALVSLMFLGLFNSDAYAGQMIEVKVWGESIDLVPQPYIENDRVMVPLRDVVTALGAEVSWDGDRQEIVVSRQGQAVKMNIGKLEAEVNGASVKLDVAPVLVENKTVVPLSFLAKGLNLEVSWDGANRTVTIEEGALLVGSSLDFLPFEYLEEGKITGFDIDLINALGNEMGKKLIIKHVDFDALIPSLISGKVDLIISALTITEHRNEIIKFSDSYFEYGEVILVPQGTNKKLVLEDLAGKRIAVQPGSYAYDLINELQEKYPATQIYEYFSSEEAWAAVENGQADAALVPHPLTANYLMNNDSKLQIESDLIASYPMGIGVQKDNQNLINQLNQTLKTIKANGTYDEIYKKWFGSW